MTIITAWKCNKLIFNSDAQIFTEVELAYGVRVQDYVRTCSAQSRNLRNLEIALCILRIWKLESRLTYADEIKVRVTTARVDWYSKCASLENQSWHPSDHSICTHLCKIHWECVYRSSKECLHQSPLTLKKKRKSCHEWPQIIYTYVEFTNLWWLLGRGNQNTGCFIQEVLKERKKFDKDHCVTDTQNK